MGCGHFHRHGAVVCALAPAAHRQASFIAARQQRRNGREAEQTQKREAEEATHLSPIVHDPQSLARGSRSGMAMSGIIGSTQFLLFPS
jgi:hypothetical protein